MKFKDYTIDYRWFEKGRRWYISNEQQNRVGWFDKSTLAKDFINLYLRPNTHESEHQTQSG